jgi:hypothetical protein
MQTAIAKLELISPYCQGRYHGEPKLNKENSPDYERRTWKERLHYDAKSKEIFVPALAFSNSIKEAAKYLSKQIPGKGKSTYTKHFDAGVSVIDDVFTGKTIDDAVEKQMFVPSDGRKGGGSRVMKSYPLLMPPLELSVEYCITDDTITPEVFADTLQQSGNLIGIGSFRIRNGGVFGRYRVIEIDWSESKAASVLPKINYV